MNKYAFKSAKIDGTAVIGYNSDGNLVSFKLDGDWSDKHYKWFLDNIHWREENRNALVAGTAATLTLIPPDLSFATFWELYKYNLGNKKRAEKEWNDTSDVNKIKALEAIPKYKRWLKTKPNMEHLMASTFLSQQRYLNTFAI